MTAPIEDVSSLPGKKVTDQEENTIGKIKEIYAMDGDGDPMWITVEASTGMGQNRLVFIPLARLKDENGDLRVPYSKDHIENTPEVEGDEISAECERKLRDHFGIDRADQELRSNNDSYATLVPEGEGTAKLVDDPDSVETPDANKVDDETKKRLQDAGSSETRNVTAEDVAHGEQGAEGGERGEDSEGDDRSDEKGDDDRSDPKASEDKADDGD